MFLAKPISLLKLLNNVPAIREKKCLRLISIFQSPSNELNPGPAIPSSEVILVRTNPIKERT